MNGKDTNPYFLALFAEGHHEERTGIFTIPHYLLERLSLLVYSNGIEVRH
jgi:hypothetical protein